MQAQQPFGAATASSPSAGVPSGWQPARSSSPRGIPRDASPGRTGAGRPSSAAGRPCAGESVGSLVFGGGGGGGYVPVLNGGGHSRSNSLAGARSAAESRAAGAAIEQQSRSRWVAEKNFDRKMKGQARSLNAQYDDYLNAVEDHTFNKLHASLGRMERKAEREHQMLSGAAGGGMSIEARNAKADARLEGRRSKSPCGLFRSAEPSRFHNDQGSSVASLLQQPDQFVRHGASPRGPASPRFGGGDWQQQQSAQGRAQSPRGRSPYQQRAASPHPTVPRIPAERIPSSGAYPGDESYRSTDRSHYEQQQQQQPFGASYAQQMRRAESPRGMRASSPRRAASPRAQRAQSPFRQRPQ